MAVPTIINPGFEIPAISNTYSIRPTTTGVGWTWSPDLECGVDSRTAQGLYVNQCCFLSAAASNTYCAQTISCDGTPFQIRLAARRRIGPGGQVLRLTFNGVTIADWSPSVWTVYTSPTITPTAGSYELKLVNLTNTGQLAIDEIEVLAIVSPLKLLAIEPESFGLVG